MHRADIDLQTERLRRAEEHGGKARFAFRDKKTDQYYAGSINPKDRTHEFDQIGTKGRINELFAQHGVPKPEIIPSVDFRFDPANDALYEAEANFINRYTPPPYLKNAKRVEGAKVPPAIWRVINHATGGDPTVVERFLNWLAVIFQSRIHTQTAWILHGTTGTGKGILFSRIIRPLVGERYAGEVNLGSLEEKFNRFAEETIVLFVDEVDTDQVKDIAKLMARLKSMITEPQLPIRAMRQDLREVPNHINLILSSNQPNSMRIEANDRRFNVCPRQEEKLLGPGESGEALVAQIKQQLPDFADYLMSRSADKALVRRTLENEPKRLLQTVTQTAIEEVAQALRNGDLAYFFEQRPFTASDNILRSPVFNGVSVPLRSDYWEFLGAASDAEETGKKHVVLHEALFAVFELLVGRMPSTKAKLTKRLGHQSLSIIPHTQSSTSVRGLAVEWQATPEELAEWRQILEEETENKVLPSSGRVPRPRTIDKGITDDGTGQ